ncbi:MAG: hypothetical protein CMP57_01240 [Flavobacteriales bacterium]|nr:hypothetical protein [Flavobacteriales bacterium]|tara:strand:+ start:8527 stop:8913 length:387 start_codon:yes stop_codon:yes gene_type:complete
MKIKMIIFLSALIISLYIAYSYVYQSHRDIRKEKPKFFISSDSLHHHFAQQQQQKSHNLYMNQVLVVEGTILSLSQQMIMLKPGISCLKDSSSEFNLINVGDRVTIKARCIGYDDLFGEVKMDQSTLN